MNEDSVRIVYMTAADEKEAAAIGTMLIERKLAACVNILGPIRSMYRWEGEVRNDPEVAFIAKTNAAKLDDLTAAVRDLHSYDCPCVAAIPVNAGNPAFLAWVRDEVG